MAPASPGRWQARVRRRRHGRHGADRFDRAFVTDLAGATAGRERPPAGNVAWSGTGASGDHASPGPARIDRSHSGRQTATEKMGLPALLAGRPLQCGTRRSSRLEARADSATADAATLTTGSLAVSRAAGGCEARGASFSYADFWCMTVCEVSRKTSGSWQSTCNTVAILYNFHLHRSSQSRRPCWRKRS